MLPSMKTSGYNMRVLSGLILLSLLSALQQTPSCYAASDSQGQYLALGLPTPSNGQIPFLASMVDPNGDPAGAQPMGPGRDQQGDYSSTTPFWIEKIVHNGTAAYNPSPNTYKVYRNVKEYGAKGDGVTDDTVAINRAVSEGPRCGPECGSSTVSPALVYFPPGKYLISSPIISYYYTQLVGDYNSRPVIVTAPNFTGFAAIDEDPYLPGGANWYINQNNFFREIRNFVIDLTETQNGTGVHHQVSQATGLYNVKFVMSTAKETNQRGVFIENGSGGLMRDLEFVGGKYGCMVGNQQFTVTNFTFTGCQEAIHAIWAWGWTYQNVKVNQCGKAFVMETGSSGVLSDLLVDWEITDTPVGIEMTGPPDNSTLVLENIKVHNVSTAIVRENDTVLLPGYNGSRTIKNWVQGTVYDSDDYGYRERGPLPWKTKRHPSLLDEHGKWFTRSRPQYGAMPASEFINVKEHGAKGDGVSDDTHVLQHVLRKHCDKVIFIPHGTYIVTDTLHIPIGSRIVGEVWSVLMGAGPRFQDPIYPTPVFKVGHPGEEGRLHITDIIFTVRGPAPGAIVLEWNVHDEPGKQGTVGMWDTHVRIGGFAGTNLQADHCAKGSNVVDDKCRAAFLGIHVTKRASGYFDNVWVWVADHDLDGDGQVNIYNGRGWLVESAPGPVWMYGTSSEHSILYQYNIADAENVLVLMGQTETPYMQGKGFPPATSVEPLNAAYKDPYFTCSPTDDPTTCQKAWGTVVSNSRNIYLYGMGQYSFFDNYTQDCIANSTCQKSIVSVDQSERVYLYNLNTIGTTSMIRSEGIDRVPATPLRRGFSASLAAWRSTSLDEGDV